MPLPIILDTDCPAAFHATRDALAGNLIGDHQFDLRLIDDEVDRDKNHPARIMLASTPPPFVWLSWKPFSETERRLYDFGIQLPAVQAKSSTLEPANAVYVLDGRIENGPDRSQDIRLEELFEILQAVLKIKNNLQQPAPAPLSLPIVRVSAPSSNSSPVETQPPAPIRELPMGEPTTKPPVKSKFGDQTLDQWIDALDDDAT